ncbi:MAG TPA: SDR family oxidoreductase [Pyrinomonadaceae bacterium]|jgi:NAD(P)-dependent dehydrogenase (short-subunit alcohol dehydrogenase family)
MLKLAGTVVLIVGAGRGIGRKSACMFAEEGANLVVASRNEAELMDLAFKLERRHAARALAVPTDARDAAAVERLVDEAKRRFGRIDTLVYAAGTGVLKPFAETTAEEFERVMQTNVGGAFNVCQSVLPIMSEQKGGRIIALPGILGRAPMAQAAAYCASKYALTGMLKSLALEYKRAGVRVSLLHLGGVNTSFWDTITMRVQRERMLTVEAAAQAVLFAATQEGEGVLNEMVLQPESHQL